MRLSILAVILSLGLALGGMAQLSWAQGVQEKVKASMDRAAHDYLKQGLILAGEGQNEAAAKAFRQALAIRPDWAEAHSLLGSALGQAEQLKEAEAELRKAVTLKPDYAEGWYYLGQFLKANGKETEAEAAFRKAQQYAR